MSASLLITLFPLSPISYRLVAFPTLWVKMSNLRQRRYRLLTQLVIHDLVYPDWLVNHAKILSHKIR